MENNLQSHDSVIDKKTTLAELKEIVKGVVGGDEMRHILNASRIMAIDIDTWSGNISELFAYRLGIVHGFAMRTMGLRDGSTCKANERTLYKKNKREEQK